MIDALVLDPSDIPAIVPVELTRFRTRDDLD